MKRLRELVRAAGDAALQLTLPLFDAPPALPPRGPVSRPPRPGAPPPRGPVSRPPPGVVPRTSPPGRGRRVATLGVHAVEYELRRSRRRLSAYMG